VGKANARDYIENNGTGPFTLSRRNDTGDTILGYNRPMYQTVGTFRDYGSSTEQVRRVVVLYTGRRWMVSFWTFQDFDVALNNFHAYWDDIFNRTTIYYSSPTDNYLPTGRADIDWYRIRRSESRGSFGTFGASYQTLVQFECLNVSCTNDRTICGRDHGTCRKKTMKPYVRFNITWSEEIDHNYCDCSNDFGGYYCENAPDGRYSADLYREYREDPVQYYNNYSGTIPYLDFWDSHLVENGTTRMTESEKENPAEGGGEL